MYSTRTQVLPTTVLPINNKLSTNSQCDLGHSRNRHPRSPPAPPLWLDPPSARVSSLAVGFEFRCTGFGFGCTGLTCASRRRERVVRTEACSEFLFHFRPFSNLDLFFRQNLKLIVDFDPAVGYRLAESVTGAICIRYMVLSY